MADHGFNGSTLTFASALVGDLQSISFSEGGNPVDITTLSSAAHVFVNGKPSFEVTCTIGGGASLALGAAGAMAIAFNDGTNETAATSMLVTNIETSGDLDGAITTTYTFQPSGA